MPTNIQDWKNLDPTGADVAGSGYARLSLLFRRDPFTRMLAEDVTDALLAAIFSPAGHGVALNDHLRVSTPEEIPARIHNVFSMSPLAIVNDGFIAHVATLTTTALFPQTQESAA